MQKTIRFFTGVLRLLGFRLARREQVVVATPPRRR